MTPAHPLAIVADRLRDEGIDAWLDRYDPAPPKGWPKWMHRPLPHPLRP